MIEVMEAVPVTRVTHVCGACRSVRTQALFWKNKKFPNASFVDLTSPSYAYGLPALNTAGCYKVRI